MFIEITWEKASVDFIVYFVQKSCSEYIPAVLQKCFKKKESASVTQHFQLDEITSNCA